jgi:PBP1b-binding outer membrane lipoprotein LpoB
MKKQILSILLLTSVLNAGMFDFFDDNEKKVITKNESERIENIQAPDFEIKEVKMLEPTVKKKNIEYLKDNFQKIKLILISIENVEKNLEGFPEQSLITEIKGYIKDKYLIQRTDLIEVKSNLNEYMEDIKIREGY